MTYCFGSHLFPRNLKSDLPESRPLYVTTFLKKTEDKRKMDKGISASFHARLKHGPCKTGTGTSASFHARLKQGPCKMDTGTSASLHARLKHGSYKMDTGTSASQKHNDKENKLVYLFSQYKLNQINCLTNFLCYPSKMETNFLC